jgi:alanyl-tRNA synthetase
MEWTGLNEIREKYLKFFESKGHLRLPSFSLVPDGDKSLLLINAGMAPMKKYFTGEVTPPSKRVTTCQKCIRTPDIERVGKTARHGTFFEMLGNFSFGDYFKREAISWAWEFCTKVLEIPLDRLYATVYLDDDEAYDIWTKEVGIAEDHIKRMGKEDNFWELDSGPCGPCSEIYFDMGEEFGCGSPDCGVGCDCDRYVEFWNLVFTQFEKSSDGEYSPLAHPNIDTGMGLERLACILQGAPNLFEVDTVKGIMELVSDISGVKYLTDAKKDVSLRVITDHIRSTVMMVGDGIMPSNEGRGYVLRRLLRRAARHGRLLGIDRPFLSELAESVIKFNAGAYPDLTEKHDYIINVITHEEENFLRTIDAGMKLLFEMLEGRDNLSGEDAFKLSDTFGFPIDLTEEIVTEQGKTLDKAKFEELSALHKQKAREARKFSGADAWKDSAAALKDYPETEFVGYELDETDTKIVALISNGELVESIDKEAKETAIVLEKTPFYALGGGQCGDTGTITGADFVFTVTETIKTAKNVYIHKGYISEGASVSAGSAVKASVNAASREAVKKNHTSAHLLHAALKSVLGQHVEQAGQSVTPELMRFDFTHFSALTSDEITAVENMVNKAIMEAKDVTTAVMSLDEAKAKGAIALFGEKYSDTVRVVSAGDFSSELCGGTHVSNTGEIGLFKIISETSVAAGVRRIEALTGHNLLQYIRNKTAQLYETAEALKCNDINDISEKAALLNKELKQKDKEIAALKAEIASSKLSSQLSVLAEIKGIKLITANIGEATADEARAAADSAKESGDDVVAIIAASQSEKGTCTFCAVCGSEAVKAGAHAGNLVKAVAAVAGGKGGGKPESAMAGGKDISKIDEALAAAEEALSAMLK